jgi:hypothetical protein
MSLIKLTQNKYSAVDEDDFIKLNRYKWHYNVKRKGDQGYAQRKSKNKIIYMHDFIVNCPPNKIVDHKDGDSLNNKKENLRICTQTNNMMNKSIMSNNKSGYKGVHFHKQTGKWRAQIKVKGKIKSLGLFDNPEDASKIRNKAAKLYHGEFAK